MSDEIMTVTKPKVKSIRHYVRNQELSLRIHTDESVFSTLETEWEKLAHLSNQMICMSSGWASRWWKHFGRHEKRSLFIVTVYDNLKLVAIFPFYKGITNVSGITIQHRLQLIGSGGSPNEQFGFSDDYGISDFLDLIVHPEYRSPVADLFVKLLASPEFANHQITFHQVRDDSYIMQTLYPLLEKSERRVSAKRTDVCYYVEVDRNGDFQDFIEKSKKNARRRFRQTLRARGPGNEYIIEEPAAMADVEQMIVKLMELHQDRWNKLGHPGAFQDEEFREFFKEITVAAYRDKKLWLKQAVDASGVCAVRMALMYNRSYYDYMFGYDVDSPSVKHRPGIGLLLNMVEDSLKQPIERIELLRGDEGYKHDFTHLSLHNWEITIPEISYWKTGWGLPGSMIQFCSFILKYFNREKGLLKVQYKTAGLLYMFSEYFKFRMNTVTNKISQMKGAK